MKRGEWNQYEILAVGRRIWTAINGKLCVAYEDSDGELSGRIAFQIHGGIAFTWEHDMHLYFRRAKTTEALFGGSSYHRSILADRIGI